MAQLFADEHFPMPVVRWLRRLGHDVLTARQICEDKSGDSIQDEEVLTYATQHRRAVLTQNRKHFERLHENHRGHAGIITCTVEQGHKVQARRIDDLIKKERRLTGKLLHLPSPSSSEQEE